MKGLRPFARIVVPGILAMQLGCWQKFDMEAIASPSQKSPEVLVVFVTGFTDKPKEMREHGVLEVIHEAAGPVDGLVVYHESIEYLTGEFVPQMQERITSQQWFQDYAKRILVGFSSGGTAALEFASKDPKAFDTVILYAPFLGPQYLIDEIGAAGGLANWSGPPPREDPEDLWLWLKQYCESPMEHPRLYFLWSRGDKVAPGLPLLEESLPPDRLIVTHGSHGWASFDRMWRSFVEDHREFFRADGSS